ncbi:MAG: ATP-binding cassette domain-containing protein [Rickettsiaceae bacterium H1]|nr:ATP-binding cassette domain-containing protein [Rickettsiaceae bacterium H1]
MSKCSLLNNYIKPYRFFIAAIFLTIIISSLAVLSLGQGIRYIIDHGLLTGDKWSSFSTIALASGLIIAIMNGAIFARICLISYTGEKIIANIRIDSYNHLLKLPKKFYEKKRTGDILSTLISDTATLQIIISGALSNALRNFVMTLGSIIMLLYTSPKLSAYSFIAIPTVILFISLLGKRVRKLSKKARDSIANIASYSEETLNGIKTIQAFTYEKQSAVKFKEYVNYTLNCFVKYEFTRALLVILIVTTVLSVVGFIFWIGNNGIINGNITYGQLSAFMFYAMLAANSISRLGEIFSELQQAAAAIQRLNELFLEPNTNLIENKSPRSIPKNITNLKFSNVTFSYSPETQIPTISDMSFTINTGEKIAIVGPSGAGKSTIIELLLRFHEISSGRITIDGIDITEFTIRDLRKLFAIVPQDPVIFSTTIMKNIILGKPEATDEEVTEAAKNANAMEFIDKLENKFESFVGEKGLKLSGGQKQRIAISRAILKNAKILLLDEATSSLDTDNERLIQESLKKLNNVITIIITHRLSTVKYVDKIMVINQGKIVDMGTHKTLFAKNVFYTKLINLQNIS